MGHFGPCPGVPQTFTIGVMGDGRERRTTRSRDRRAWLPPRWFVVLFWHGHRTVVRATRGRLGLWRPKPDGWGALRLTTIGRRSGRPRQVLVGYFQDGPNLVTLAMNGWAPAEPAWWLNLQAHPEAIAQTRTGLQHAHARRAEGTERERLWSRWAEIDRNLEAYAARRPGETAVVVLEPADAAEPAVLTE
jgi:F420H(2)-dependent quinone reductase